jgi:hypothetical protein
MPDRELATAADYADALLAARRAKHTLVLLLLLMLLGQLAVFFTLKYTDVITIPTTAATQPSQEFRINAFHYASGLCLFLGVTLSILLGFVLLLIVNIMLVGRLIGLSRVIGAYLLSLVLAVLLFPWQAFLNNVNLTPTEATFKVPGVLYTWNEVSHETEGARFATQDMKAAALKWARYAGMPIVAAIVLLVVQVKSNRGIRQALGEDDASSYSDDTTDA